MAVIVLVRDTGQTAPRAGGRPRHCYDVYFPGQELPAVGPGSSGSEAAAVEAWIRSQPGLLQAARGPVYIRGPLSQAAVVILVQAWRPTTGTSTDWTDLWTAAYYSSSWYGSLLVQVHEHLHT